jgi:hypothetical protein
MARADPVPSVGDRAETADATINKARAPSLTFNQQPLLTHGQDPPSLCSQLLH